MVHLSSGWERIVDLRKVKKLIELFEESELVELEITEGESTIRLSRGGSTSPYAPIYAPQVLPVAEAAHVKPADSPRNEEVLAGSTIDSPMVGTFYDASSPDTDAYVSVGSVVKPGDVLCIIEAMKTFNQLDAEVSGTIRAIYKSSGDPVEFGEPLFLID